MTLDKQRGTVMAKPSPCTQLAGQTWNLPHSYFVPGSLSPLCATITVPPQPCLSTASACRYLIANCAF